MTEISNTPKRLASFGTMKEQLEVKTIDQVLEQDLTITGYRMRKGTMGAYFMIDCITGDGEKITVMTGAKYVMEALADVNKQGAFPVVAKFFKRGQTVLVE